MESDGKDKLIEKFRERAAALKMPESVRKMFDKELAKRQGLVPASSEANVTRNYLDWLTQVRFSFFSLLVFYGFKTPFLFADPLGSSHT